MVDHIRRTTLQFSPKQPTDAKLRRLMDEISRTQDTLNQLIDLANTLSAGGGNPIAVHELASESGLGPEHVVAGLVAGHVLKAISDDIAQFAILHLEELSQMDFTGGVHNGDLLYFTGGYWKPTPAADVLGLGDPGADTVLGWSVTAGTQVYRTAGLGIGLDDGSIFVKPGDIEHGALAGLDQDDHPQYTQWSQNETIAGAWIFQSPTVFLNPVYFNTDTIQQEAEAPEQILIADDALADEHRWAVQAFPGMLQYQTRFDDGTVGEAWMAVSRVGELVNSIDFSGDRLAFNGAAVTTETELALNALDSEDMSYFMAVQ